MSNLSSSWQHLKYSEMAQTSFLPVPFQSKHFVFSTHHQNFHILNSPGPLLVEKSTLRMFPHTKKPQHASCLPHSLIANKNKINCMNTGVFPSKQSFQEPEATTTPNYIVRTEKAVSGHAWKWEPQAGGAGYHVPTWKRDARLPLKLSKTRNVSFQGRQSETKGISYFLRNISANMQPTLQRSTGVA